MSFLFYFPPYIKHFDHIHEIKFYLCLCDLGLKRRLKTLTQKKLKSTSWGRIKKLLFLNENSWEVKIRVLSPF
jgi:hypothetical protein